jgi:Undecaprenyl-phosphate galactose phosphotransferase WbaP
MSEEPITNTRYTVFTPTGARGSELGRSRRTSMTLVLAGADLLGYLFAWLLALFCRFTLTGVAIPKFYESFALVLPLSLMLHMVSGLYNNNLSEVEEFKRLFQTVTINYLIVFSGLYFLRSGEVVSRLAIFMAWVFALASVPLARESIRQICVKYGLWGEPVVIFGNGMLGNEVVSYLRAHPKMGYNPVGVVDRRKVDRVPGNAPQRVIHDAAIFNDCEKQPDWLKGIRTAFVVTPETSQNVREMLIDKQTIRFEQLILVNSGEKTGSVWVQPLDIGGILGLEVGQNLLNTSQLLAKRVMDLGLIFLSAPILGPFIGLIALLIKLDSNGSVFYYQDRIGFGGKTFKFWKFRSMVDGADQVLEAYLEANPDARAEYEVNHKLKNDPRVTKFGKFIRKFSIDELPQLINVLRGDMSLVGPRPFMGTEIGFYDKCYSLYTYVQPGVTGLWQISGRSNVAYTTRVSMDDYYLRNWSIWLDIHILIRTIGVVLRGRGSY